MPHLDQDANMNAGVYCKIPFTRGSQLIGNVDRASVPLHAVVSYTLAWQSSACRSNYRCSEARRIK